MALSDKKLYCGSKKDNIITDTVNLYTSLSDVENKGKLFKFNGQNLYAKYSDLNESKASLIRINIDGDEKALLRTAITSVVKTYSVLKDEMISHYWGGLTKNNTTKKIDIYKAQYTNNEAGLYIPIENIPSNATNVRLLINNISNVENVEMYIAIQHYYPSNSGEVEGKKKLGYYGYNNSTIPNNISLSIDKITYSSQLQIIFEKKTNDYEMRASLDSIILTYDLLEKVEYIDDFTTEDNTVRRIQVSPKWIDDRGDMNTTTKKYILAPWYRADDVTSESSQLDYVLKGLRIPQNAKNIKFEINIESYEYGSELIINIGGNRVFKSRSSTGVKIFSVPYNTQDISIFASEYVTTGARTSNFYTSIVVSGVKLSYDIVSNDSQYLDNFTTTRELPTPNGISQGEIKNNLLYIRSEKYYSDSWRWSDGNIIYYIGDFVEYSSSKSIKFEFNIKSLTQYAKVRVKMNKENTGYGYTYSEEFNTTGTKIVNIPIGTKYIYIESLNGAPEGSTVDKNEVTFSYCKLYYYLS